MNIAFIPARCGSKSIPLKNIKEFCGRPLIYWNLIALQNSSSIDKIFVATDCMEVILIVNSFNFSKVKIYNRNTKNAQDESSTESVMLEFLNANDFDDDDLFLLVQATSPLTQTIDFDEAIRKIEKENIDSLLTCVRVKRFLWDLNASPINYNYQQRPRRQDFNGVYLENGSFYISTIDRIKKSKNRLSGRIAIYEMAEFTAVEIDEEDDWMIAETLMLKHILTTKPKKSIKLFLSDVDGTLTDAGMYYGNNGEEFKKFNTHDGKGFELLRSKGIKTGIITSESTQIVENRAKKMKIDYLYQGKEFSEKLEIAKEICLKENITMEEVAYIGDDVNCLELLKEAGISACPASSVVAIKGIPGILLLKNNGGNGAVREFIEYILK